MTPAGHTPGPWSVEPAWDGDDHATISAPTTQTALNERGKICGLAGTAFTERAQANRSEEHTSELQSH